MASMRPDLLLPPTRSHSHMLRPIRIISTVTTTKITAYGTERLCIRFCITILAHSYNNYESEPERVSTFIRVIVMCALSPPATMHFTTVYTSAHDTVQVGCRA